MLSYTRPASSGRRRVSRESSCCHSRIWAPSTVFPSMGNLQRTRKLCHFRVAGLSLVGMAGRQLVLFTLPKAGSIYAYPLRVACEQAIASGSIPTWGVLALRCGYQRPWHGKSGDGERLKRLLGVTIQGKQAPTKTIHIKTALRIIDALGMAPVDFGL